MTRLIATAVLLVTMLGSALAAQSTGTAVIRVKETAGIRRNGYPAHATVNLPQGALPDAGSVRLVSNGKEVPGQYTATANWPDGSVRALDVDFNASLGPGEESTFQLEYGAAVKSEATARGLTVTETADTIQVGNVRFNKTAIPLLASVNYRQEDIGPGPNGFTITDTGGASYDMSRAENVKAEILKRGPLYVVIRYSGQMRLDGEARVPFSVLIEMPNSKTWWKATASFDDAAKRVRSIAFHSPLTLGALPWLWDFGTGSWSYGSFRNKTDSVIFTQTVTSTPRIGTPHATKGKPDATIGNPDPSNGKWVVATGSKGQEQPYEIAAGRRAGVAEGWGHIQDAKEAVAFAVEDFGKAPGTYTLSIDGEGHLSVQLAPTTLSPHRILAIYQHFVATPVPIGAVTSPVSMLNPLLVTVAKPGR